MGKSNYTENTHSYDGYKINSNGYVTLNNCPQVQSLAASVAFDRSQRKYKYEESEVKCVPENCQINENEHKMRVSIALSTKNFDSNNNIK